MDPVQLLIDLARTSSTIFLLGLVVALLYYPEKIEKWSALLWRMINRAGVFAGFAHKKYVKHDLQGRVNDFVRRLSHRVPDADNPKISIDWIDPKMDRKAFFDGDKVVLRLRPRGSAPPELHPRHILDVFLDEYLHPNTSDPQVQGIRIFG